MPQKQLTLELLTAEIKRLHQENQLLQQELLIQKTQTQLLQKQIGAPTPESSQQAYLTNLPSGPEEQSNRNEEMNAIEEELRQSLEHTLELNEKIATSEAQYRLISESMRDMICLHDLEGIYTYVTPSSKNLVGYEPEELLGKNPYDYFHPEDIEKIRVTSHNKTRQGLADTIVEYRFRHKKGHYVWLETVTEALRNENNEIYGLHTASRDISQRKQVEKERDNFFNYSIDILTIIDYEGKIIRANFAWEYILGFPVKETEGNFIYDFIHPEDVNKTLAILSQHKQEADVTIDFETRYLCKDGNYRWVSWNYVPFPSENLVYGFGRDITQLKLSEEAARLAQFSIDHASDSVFWIGPDASILRVNKTACLLLGYTEEEMLRMKVADTDPNYSEEVWPEHWQELREKKNMIFESAHRTKDGTIRPTEVSVNYFQYNGKEYNFAFARDITERKQAEERLQFNSLILSRVNDAIVGVDQQYNINYWSESAERQYGLSAADVLEKPLSTAYTFEWLHPEDEQHMATSLAQKGYCKFEVRQTLYNGKKLFAEMVVQQMTDLFGKNMGLFAIIHDITERKQAEQQLLERETMLEIIFNESTDALFLVESESGKIIKCNNKAIEFFEADSEEELKGKFGPSFHKHPFTEQHMQDKVETILREGEWSSEIEYISLKGNEFWGAIKVKYINIVESQYQLVRIADITSRKQAQADLLRYAQRSINILESVTDAMFTVDHNWCFTYFNKEAEIMTKMNRSELLQKNMWNIFSDALGADFFEQCHLALSQHTDVHFEGYSPPLQLWFEAHIYPFEEGLSIYLRNINERKASEKAILESEEKFRTLTIQSPVGILTTTPDGFCTWTNPRLQEIAGYTFEESLGDGWAGFIHQDDVERIVEEWKNNAQSGLSTVSEYRFVHKNGNIRWVRGTTNPVLSDTGEHIGHVGTVEDITERREAEEKLRSALEELKKRNHELDNYVYKVSHDLRAPLTSIMGLVNLIKIETDPNTIRHYIDLIENRVIKSDQFIHSILSHSKILNSQVQINRVDFQSIILDSFDQLKYMPHSDRLQVHILIQGPAEFWSDVFRIDIILKNFISNAIKYMNLLQQENFVHFNISITQKEGIIEIKDNGLGIDKQYQPKIFDMFFRATEKADGSGLGLYIVKQTIERMGGSIHIESEIGQGTTFTITLPNLIQKKPGVIGQ
ncbi:PAS domain S-box protein [Rhodocytophaga rosea]|uniref:histidine kinase n=1 Tax=Rhodocytophaga rosea TaxID=2704465 RepID=A0A6C0GEE3_9BACT|nr:PAS domain S-box protein [Rhodocytophaga rosea]QHT66143.1 PAS domain S-box protein [Rhodocytophaga rosea]